MHPVADFSADQIIWQPTPKQSDFLACDDFEVLYGGAAGGGKLLRTNAKILTPKGWVRNGDLKQGDVVVNPRTGGSATISIAHPVVNERVYRVVFNDGTHLDAGKDHLWTVKVAGKRNKSHDRERNQGHHDDWLGGYRVITTAMLMEHVDRWRDQSLRGVRSNGPMIPVNRAVEFTRPYRNIQYTLPVDPYLLGLLIGDGHIDSLTVTSVDQEIADSLDTIAERMNAVVRHDGGNRHHRIVGADKLRKDLKRLGLMGSRSWEKFIPEDYLFAPLSWRSELMKGLMDTDGYVDDRGHMSYTTTSGRLAGDVATLARSLGAYANITTKQPTYAHNGQRKEGRLAYSVWIKAHDPSLFVRLSRKADRAIKSQNPPVKRVIDVQVLDETAPMRCITLDTVDGLYIADDYTVTHNSDALLIDALCLQHDGIYNPRHRAVLFRRSFPELRDLIDRAREIYPLIVPGAEYNQQDKIFTFPSGAKVEFGYLQHDNDRFKYRGRAWNYIGFDELTLWATPTCYLYLFSRCRSTDKSLPRYIRSTTNPDGPGQKWVMERWGIDESGRETNLPVDIIDDELGIITMMRRRFIPARLIDNDHLAGTGYREALLQLPPDEREALLKGLWKGNKVKGAYYINEMAFLRQNGRIRSVPYTPGEPVNTFWDLGWNDTTAIWFHQFITGEHRFIHAYENSGEAFDHYAQYLLSRGYVFGTHHLPHDASNTSLQTGKTNLQILTDLLPGHRFAVVPRIDETLIGINQTRMAMRGNVYIDEVECGDGIVALDNYRKRYVEKIDAFADEPVHDRYSNYADAFRQWGQGFDLGITRGTQRRRTRHRSGMAA